MRQEMSDFVSLLVGKKLDFLGCEADLLEFVFEEDLVLHAAGFSRVAADDEILITTADYQSWDGIDSTHNDEWFNMAAHRERIVGGRVVSAAVNALGDLNIALDNGVTVECRIANAAPHYGEEAEQWVLFEHTADHSGRFLTAYNKQLDYYVPGQEG